MDGWVTSAFWLCLAVGAIYTIVSFIMGGIFDIAGGHGDFGHAHGDFSHEYGVGGGSGHGEAMSAGQVEGGAVIFGPFSPLVIAFFLTCFGGVGLMLSEFGKLGAVLSLPIAAVSGFVLAWLLVLLFNRVIGSIQGSSEVRLHTLVDTEAEVTVEIPAQGVGEIAYIAMGSRCVAPARSEDQAIIPRFAAVRISRIVGNMFFVRPVVEEQLRSMVPDVEDTPEPSSVSTDG